VSIAESTPAQVPVQIEARSKRRSGSGEIRRKLSAARLGSGRLDLEAKLFQESLWPDVLAVANGETLTAPIVVELDPTSFCDMKCPECISANLLNQTRFTNDRLAALAGEMVDLGVRAVILIGGGEPLLHNAIGEVIQTLGEAGIAIGVTTNGTMLHRYLDAIADLVSWTRVSVDAGTPRCFERMRPHRTGRNVFHQVIGNMRRLASVKSGSLGYSFLLVARTTPDGSLKESNFGDVTAAATLARDIGCDYFEVKPTYDLAHFLTEQPPSLRRLLDEQLETARGLATDGFDVLSPRTLDAAQDEAYTQPKSYDQCPVTELRTLITASGAFACPYHRGNPAARFGDPLEQTMGEMWSSDERLKVRSSINPTTACRFHCIRHESNLTLLHIAEQDVSARLVPDYDPFL
jgi:wyosine [tRNA(Phe)-imidazoG37] synthetase (radical SAM superfamily)